jgi:uncharacterized protein with ACT and thioredoxin-like domain
MAKQSVRVQMYPETHKVLEKLAEQHGCSYGGKPSISELLAKIASGQLSIDRAKLNRSQVLNSALVKLRMMVPTDLKGTATVILERIAKYRGNITDIKFETKSNLGYIQLWLSLPEESDLANLIYELQKIKIGELSEFNSLDEFGSVVAKTRPIEDLTIYGFQQDNLILYLAGIIGFKLKILDRSNVLASITRKISEEGFFISWIKYLPHEQSDFAFIEIVISLQETTRYKLTEQVKKSQSLHKEIAKIKAVLGCERIDVSRF